MEFLGAIMKKICLVLVLVFCIGCSGSPSILNRLPDKEFKTFSYTRAGFGGNAFIEATGAVINDARDTLTIEHIKLKEVTPVCTIEITVDNYVKHLTVITK